MSFKVGLDCKLYYGEAGATANNLIPDVKEVTLTLEKTEIDASTRGGGGWKGVKSGLKAGTVEFTMVWDPGDAAFDAIQSAFFNNTAVALAILDDETGTGHGLDADFQILTFTRNEPLDDLVTVNVTAKPDTEQRTPEWI